MVRERLRSGRAGTLVLAVGAADDRAVGEQATLAVEDRRTVEFAETGQRLRVEIASRR